MLVTGAYVGRDGFSFTSEGGEDAARWRRRSVVEIAPHNGVIRYALAPGNLTFDAQSTLAARLILAACDDAPERRQHSG